MKKNNSNYGEKYTKVGLLFQGITLIGLLVTFIISLYDKKFFIGTEILSVLLLGVMAFNNLYKNVNKKLGITYVICASLILVTILITLIFGK